MARPAQSPESLEATRTAIIDAANSIMLEKGVEAISIRRIAAMVGCGPSSIYYYFKNRDDILFALWQSVTSRTDDMADCLLSIKEPEQRLLRLCSGIVRFGRDNPSEYELICTLEPLVELGDRTPFSKGHDLLRQFVEETITKALPDVSLDKNAARIEAHTQAFWASAHGCIRLQSDIRSVELIEHEEMIDIICRSLLSTITQRQTFE